MELPVLGIDVSKRTLDVCLLRADGSAAVFRCANQPSGFQALRQWLQSMDMASVHACLEATGSYGQAVAQALHQNGHRVSVVNPRQIHAFAESELRRNKTDPLDAAVIARFCRSHRPPQWFPADPDLAELQALVRRLEALLQMRQQEANRQESALPSVRGSIDEHLQFLDRQIEQTRRAIRNHIDSHPQLRSRRDLLCSIPGIGPNTAASLLAEIPALDQFPKAKAAAAFCGLTPRLHLSGTSIRRTAHLSKVGSPRIRKALYLPAVVARSCNPLVRDLSRRLAANGKPPMLIIAAAMRKLIHLAYGVLKTGKPFDPCFGSLDN